MKKKVNVLAMNHVDPSTFLISSPNDCHSGLVQCALLSLINIIHSLTFMCIMHSPVSGAFSFFPKF